MTHFFITGTSRGIGKALAEKLLENIENRITGISRNQTITHEKYNHIFSDFQRLEEISKIDFKINENTTKIVLINNAGMLGEILKIGRRNNNNISTELSVNLLAPIILVNNFAKSFQNLENERLVVNLSSGAGKSAIDSWSTYCTAKAGIDMFSLVFEKEQKLFPKKKRIKIFSVAPGVVETAMQEQIRATNPTNFSTIQRFIDLKNNNQLLSTQQAANKILKIIDTPKNYHNTILDVRQL